MYKEPLMKQNSTNMFVYRQTNTSSSNLNGVFLRTQNCAAVYLHYKPVPCIFYDLYIICHSYCQSCKDGIENMFIVKSMSDLF